MKIGQIYRKYNKSENAKRIIGNFASLSTLQVLSYLFPLITTPYLAHVIGVEGFGSIAFASAIIVYFSTISDWGFKYTAVREISLNRENKGVVSSIFCRVMLCKILLMTICAVVLFFLILIIPLFKENSTILWATFMLVPGYILFPDWLYQAMEEMKYITIMNIVAKLIFTGLVFIVIKKQEDFVIEPLLQASGYLVSGVIAFTYAVCHFKLKIFFPSVRDSIKMLGNSSNMFISQFFPTLYNNLSIILLEWVSGPKANGLFSAGNKFVSIMDQISQALSRAFYPFLARRMDKHHVYVIISGSISIAMSLTLFFLADLLIKVFYTAEFSSASLVIKIMSCSPFFLFLMNSFGTNGLVLIGKDNILRNIVVITSIIGLILSIIGIFFWSYYGVAIAIVSTWGLRGILTYIFYKKNLNKNYLYEK